MDADNIDNGLIWRTILVEQVLPKIGWDKINLIQMVEKENISYVT